MITHTGQLVFAQVMAYLPLKAFSRMVAARRAQHKYFYHMGLRCKTVSRNTLANANRFRPWEVFADLAHRLIRTARTLYANEPAHSELASLMGTTGYALDSTTIDLCVSIFNWTPFRTIKAAIKLHTLIDLKGSIRSFIHISGGKIHDVKVLDILCEQGYIEAGAVSRYSSTRDFLRLRNKQYTRISDKQSHSASQYNLRTGQSCCPVSTDLTLSLKSAITV